MSVTMEAKETFGGYLERKMREWRMTPQMLSLQSGVPVTTLRQLLDDKTKRIIGGAKMQRWDTGGVALALVLWMAGLWAVWTAGWLALLVLGWGR